MIVLKSFVEAFILSVQTPGIVVSVVLSNLMKHSILSSGLGTFLAGFLLWVGVTEGLASISANFSVWVYYVSGVLFFMLTAILFFEGWALRWGSDKEDE